ncbi:MAG: hypothetical protein A2041_08760 [Bacteroidetes bacterium GWA2_31_9b]|nr:MAG: hypothetical protein A2041_08760 [Bacteroidetes bacterium GWA2_31_9b]
MENLFIEPTEFSPKVILDVKNKRFELSGVSRPEDVVAFYESITLKAEDYVSQMLKNEDVLKELTFELTFDLIYINSASSKYILQILDIFKKLSLKGSVVNCNWYYEDVDDQILEDGEDLSEVIRMDFNFIDRK